MAHTQDRPNVVICGGGPGGFLASILLNNIGIKSTVIEKAAEPDQWSSKSYSMIIGERGQAALNRGGCLESAKKHGLEKTCICFVDGQSGTVKAIPRQESTPGIGFSRPLLVECIEKKAIDLPNVTIKRGTGVSNVAVNEKDQGLEVCLEDGTIVPATHVIGADGKWSKVRQSIPSLKSQGKMMTEPAFGVSMFVSNTPEGWKTDGIHIVKAPEECAFYVIFSFLVSGGASITVVCGDQTVEKYPWLEPPAEMKSEDYGKGGWGDEYSALPSGKELDDVSLPDHMEQMFQEMLPGLHAVLDKEAYKSVRVNRRASWLQMSPVGEDKKVSYSTEDGLVALVGDAAHAMTASMGEGGNCAMESAAKLVETVISLMKEREETECTVDTFSQALVQYGLSRPPEVQPIQEMSAARNRPQKL